MSTHHPESSSARLPAAARIAIIAARFNAFIVDELLNGCSARLEALGASPRQIETFRVPGAFELPVAATAAARSGRFAAVICLGCVIRGDTPHFEYVAGEAARGIGQAAVNSGIPIIFGVLTTNTEEQALQRAGGAHGHAGKSAADAAVEMIAVLEAISGK